MVTEPDNFGAFFRACRVETGLTLRAFCLRHGFDPGNVSKMERGRLLPPESPDKLAIYAEALGIAEGTPKREEFFDRAAAEQGRIPPDLLSDDEVRGKLPVLFRTIRGQKLDGALLDDLVERIRRA